MVDPIEAPAEISPGSLVEQVRESYRQAHAKGMLKSSWIPLATASRVWNTANLPLREDYLKANVLNETGIQDVNNKVEQTLARIPNRKSWTRYLIQKRLDAQSISDVIGLVKGTGPVENPRPCAPDTALTELITKFRCRAQELQRNGVLLHHASILAEMIESSLMAVQEYQKGGDRTASKEVSFATPEDSKLVTATSEYHYDGEESRKFWLAEEKTEIRPVVPLPFCSSGLPRDVDPFIASPWYESSPQPVRNADMDGDCPLLRKHFTCSSPAFFFELYEGLRCKMYVTGDEESWTQIPSFLDVLKGVMGGCASSVPSSLSEDETHGKTGTVSSMRP